MVTLSASVQSLTPKLKDVRCHTSELVGLFLDMISYNEQGHHLEDIHFKDSNGTFTFRDKIEDYLDGFTTRVYANLFTPHGGGTDTNNTTESWNKVSHKHMSVHKDPVAHVLDMITHMHSVSLNDCSFDTHMHRDIWHHDSWIAVAHVMNFQPYPSCPKCVFNIMDHDVEYTL